MTLSRVNGPMLSSNLTRDGVDLAFETNLLYIDVNNSRLGVGTATPNVRLDVNGAGRIASFDLTGSTLSTTATNSNLVLSPNGTGNVIVNSVTANRILASGANKEIVSTSMSFDGTTLSVTNANVTNLLVTTVTSGTTNGNVTLAPNGTGNVIVSTVSPNLVIYSGANKEMLTSANLAFTGTTLSVTGNANVTTLNAGNVQVTGNTITTGTGNLTLSSAANVIVNTATANRVFVSGANKELITDANLTYVSSTGTLSVGSIGISGLTISTTTGNLQISNGSFKTVVSGTGSIQIPNGGLAQRPTGTNGDVRVNTDNGGLEYFSGGWKTVFANSGVIYADQFTGNGTNKVFTLSQSSTTNGVIVTINGVVQSPVLSYTVSGTTLTFDEAPLSTDIIDVRMMNIGYDVQSFVVGLGQTWTNVLASRANATDYQNTTGKPIQVAISGVGASLAVSVGSTTASYITQYTFNSTVYTQASFIVPPNHYYKTTGTGTISVWNELR